MLFKPSQEAITTTINSPVLFFATATKPNIPTVIPTLSTQQSKSLRSNKPK
jgi:hypothetical protein